MMRAWRVLPWLVPLTALALVFAYGVDVPTGDQWSTGLFLVRAAAGQLGLADIVQQVNDSRPVFPRLVFLGLARAIGWHSIAEMLVSQALLLASALAIATLWRRTRTPAERHGAAHAPNAANNENEQNDAFTLLTAFLALYSLAQTENFYWGIQVVAFTPFACLLGILLLATGPRSPAAAVAGSAVLSFVATFSYANGMLCWLLAPIALLGARARGRRPGVAVLAGWIAMAVVTIALYFFRYDSNGQGLGARDFSILKAIAAYCAFLGSGLSFGHDRLETAMVCGAALLAGLAACARDVWLRPDLRRAALPWLVIAAYTLINGAAIVKGRLAAGPGYMLATRYVTFSAPAIIGFVCLVTMCLAHRARRRARPPAATGDLRVWAGVLTAIATLSIVSSVGALPETRETARLRLQMKAVLQFLDAASPALKAQQFTIFLPEVAERAPILQRAGYLPSMRDVTWDGAAREAGCVEARLPSAELPGSSTLSGWATFPGSSRPADAVLMTRDDAASRDVVAITVPTAPRPDLAAARGWRTAPAAGWHVTIDDRLAHVPLTAWAFDAARRRAWRLCAAEPAPPAP